MAHDSGRVDISENDPMDEADVEDTTETTGKKSHYDFFKVVQGYLD